MNVLLPNTDAIRRATEAERQAAAMALRSVRDKHELVSVWARDCDHFSGRDREYLQTVYGEVLAKFVPMGRAG